MEESQSAAMEAFDQLLQKWTELHLKCTAAFGPNSPESCASRELLRSLTLTVGVATGIIPFSAIVKLERERQQSHNPGLGNIFKQPGFSPN